jgi:hypothetical protein
VKTYQTGQAVEINRTEFVMAGYTDTGNIKMKAKVYQGPATLMYPYSDQGSWSVIYKNKYTDQFEIHVFGDFELKPYKNKCWGEDCDGTVDSSINPTCNKCFWVKCPKCGRCKQTSCQSPGFVIRDVIIPLKLNPQV